MKSNNFVNNNFHQRVECQFESSENNCLGLFWYHNIVGPNIFPVHLFSNSIQWLYPILASLMKNFGGYVYVVGMHFLVFLRGLILIDVVIINRHQVFVNNYKHFVNTTETNSALQSGNSHSLPGGYYCSTVGNVRNCTIVS